MDTSIKNILVRKSLRQQLTSVAHDDITSAHLELRKTLDRLQRWFYWHAINSGVKRYCRSCVIFQRLSKSGERMKALLINLPLIDEHGGVILLKLESGYDRHRNGCILIWALKK